HSEALALACQDVQGGAADRAGGPEDRDADAHATPNRRSNPAVAGKTKYRESSRSSTPPWPGIRDDEPLTPASRLHSDSATSPTWAASATTAPTAASRTALSGKPRRV